MSTNHNRFIWLLIYISVLLWSFIEPKDRTIWLLEVFPALVALIILTVTINRYRLTPLLYQLILIHCIILMIGGHYTYAEVPAFDWLRDSFDLSRNHYDKVGHFVQGFVPAIICREILIRNTAVEKGKMMFFLVLCVSLAISAFYEILEWWVAITTEENAAAFLATQGDVWDTQSDMLLALLGAILAQLILSHIHDRQLKKLLRA